MRRRFRHVPVQFRLLVCAALLACEGGGAAPERGELVLRQPRLSIGVADGDSAYLLFGAWHAQRMRDGRIVVSNTGTQQVRIYDDAGRHQRTIGRSGSGPGEFRGLQYVALIAGDSIAAYDVMLGRISIFSPEGDLARATQVQPFGNNVLPRATGFTAAGHMLVHTDFDRMFRQGPRRDTIQYGLLSADGTVAATLGRYRGEETHMLTGSDGAVRRVIAFGRNTHASARVDRVIVGSSDTFRIDVFDDAGRRLQSIAHSATPRRVQRAEVQAADAEWLATRPPQFRETAERRIAEFPYRETYPLFGDLLIGVDGSVWVQEYPTPGQQDRRWTVFDSTGQPVRRVGAGSGLSLTDAGADFVIGRVRDEFGVERILLFDLPALPSPGSRQ